MEEAPVTIWDVVKEKVAATNSLFEPGRMVNAFAGSGAPEPLSVNPLSLPALVDKKSKNGSLVGRTNRMDSEPLQSKVGMMAAPTSHPLPVIWRM